jgi:hypothetical protein
MLWYKQQGDHKNIIWKLACNITAHLASTMQHVLNLVSRPKDTKQIGVRFQVVRVASVKITVFLNVAKFIYVSGLLAPSIIRPIRNHEFIYRPAIMSF